MHSQAAGTSHPPSMDCKYIPAWWTGCCVPAAPVCSPAGRRPRSDPEIHLTFPVHRIFAQIFFADGVGKHSVQDGFGIAPFFAGKVKFSYDAVAFCLQQQHVEPADAPAVKGGALKISAVVLLMPLDRVGAAGQRLLVVQLFLIQPVKRQASACRRRDGVRV